LKKQNDKQDLEIAKLVKSIKKIKDHLLPDDKEDDVPVEEEAAYGEEGAEEDGYG